MLFFLLFFKVTRWFVLELEIMEISSQKIYTCWSPILFNAELLE